MSKSMITAATLTGLLALSPAYAQSSATSSSSKTASKTSASSSTLSSSDRKFLTDASQGGMVEVELGKIAAQKGSNADVKSFGQRMVDDHSKANDKLRQVAASKSVTLSDKLSPAKQKEVEKYSKLSGAAFDSAYISHMVSDHKEDVAEFQRESKNGKDTDIKAFATNTLPTLQDHLKMAMDVSSKLHASKSSR